MQARFFQAAAVILIVLLAALVGQPYLDRLLFAATAPRPVAARSDLAEAERATISLFERASPSVVQVVGAAAPAVGAGATDEGEAGREQSGTGVVWDGA